MPTQSLGTGTVGVADGRSGMANAMQAAMARALNGGDPRNAAVARLLEAEAAAVEAAQASKMVSDCDFVGASNGVDEATDDTWVY